MIDFDSSLVKHIASFIMLLLTLGLALLGLNMEKGSFSFVVFFLGFVGAIFSIVPLANAWFKWQFDNM